MSSSADSCSLVTLGVVLGSACGAPLPTRTEGAEPRLPAPAIDAGADLRIQFDPDALAGAVSPVTRITVSSSDPLADPRVLLVPGALTAAQLRDLGRPTVPQTLLSRALSTLVWLEADPRVLVVAPLAALEPGGSYTLALSAPMASFAFTVVSEAPPALVRLWPDRAEIAPSARAAVWCGSGALGPLDVSAILEPALLAGRFLSGTGGSIAAQNCISWFSADEPASNEPDPSVPWALPPPAVTFDDGSRAALEPFLLFRREAAPAPLLACGPTEIPFGPGCAEVEDDRIVVRPGDDPILWTIDLGEGAFVQPSRGAKPFTLRPLPTHGVAHVGALDPSGRVLEADIAIQAAYARPHVVLNEVLANPAGAEPSQEWVELYNDGSESMSLAGFLLEDAGGRTLLPDVSLGAGRFALIVPEAFVADDGADPPPPPDTVLLRVPALGRAGLSNEGEMLTLRAPTGIVVSTFPALKTKNGVSTARVAPDAPDADTASFVSSPNGTSTPGAPNVKP